jgi:hypothetical protein
MIDKNALTNLSCWVNLNPRQEASKLSNKARKQRDAEVVKSMSDAM